MPFSNSHVMVTIVGRTFFMVQGFGWTVLYNPNGQIYVRLEPVYRLKVGHTRAAEFRYHV